jgi:uncharacterized Zn-binding protein involved in type VI secretion
MRSSDQVLLARVAAVLSTFTVVAVVACSDAPSSVRQLSTGSAAFDHGGKGSQGKGDHGKGDQGKGNEGPRNQDNPRDTAKQNPKDTVKQNDQRVKLEARLMAVAGDTTFRGAEGNAEFESRTTEMKFKISVEHVPAGTVVNFFLGTTMVGTATARGGEAELSLDSNKGDTVPVAAVGTAVSAQTAAGHVIASGKF